jgi:HK97 family phage major capsid protein
MSKNLKALQNRAAAVSKRMRELSDLTDRTPEQDSELRSLVTESGVVKQGLEFEKNIADAEAQLRSTVEPAAPAPTTAVAPAPAPAVEETTEARSRKFLNSLEIRGVPVPHHTQLRAFNERPEDVEVAYRMGRWIKATFFKHPDDIQWCKDHGVEARALGENANSTGGALVPTDFASRVVRLVENYGTFASSPVEKVTMTRDTMIIPKRVTGTTAYFIGEGVAVQESQPSYANVQLVARKLAVSSRMSSEVVEDSLISLADALAAEFATSLAFQIDQCGWIGDGSSNFGGITGIVNKLNNGSYPNSMQTADAGRVSFETLTISDFLKLVAKLPLYARQGAQWYISPAGYAASMARLRYAAGGNTIADLGGGVTETFLGYPVNQVHVMNSTLGSDPSAVKVLFGNLALSSIYARRRDFSVRMYDQVYATTDQLLLQGTLRFDIVHHTLSSKDGSGTDISGPVTALKTAAS